MNSIKSPTITRIWPPKVRDIVAAGHTVFNCVTSRDGMQPIHELLSRIRWDTEFGQGQFQLGYHDRVADQVLFVALNEVLFPDDGAEVFELTDHAGTTHRIPFHRVREVRKNGQVIWKRP
jgi:uncharacterized protein (UPF0248 family)